MGKIIFNDNSQLQKYYSKCLISCLMYEWNKKKGPQRTKPWRMQHTKTTCTFLSVKVEAEQQWNLFVPVTASGMISVILASAFNIRYDLYSLDCYLRKIWRVNPSTTSPCWSFSPLLPHFFGTSLLDRNTLSPHAPLISHNYLQLHYIH